MYGKTNNCNKSPSVNAHKKASNPITYDFDKSIFINIFHISNFKNLINPFIIYKQS